MTDHAKLKELKGIYNGMDPDKKLTEPQDIIRGMVLDWGSGGPGICKYAHTSNRRLEIY